MTNSNVQIMYQQLKKLPWAVIPAF